MFLELGTGCAAFFSLSFPFSREEIYSHSMVPGGFEVTS
jgi:hypothetical protein